MQNAHRSTSSRLLCGHGRPTDFLTRLGGRRGRTYSCWRGPAGCGPQKVTAEVPSCAWMAAPSGQGQSGPSVSVCEREAKAGTQPVSDLHSHSVLPSRLPHHQQRGCPSLVSLLMPHLLAQWNIPVWELHSVAIWL